MDGPFKLMVGKEALGAYLAVPEAGSGPGVLVIHSWWGLTPFYGALCERLAANGFVALAPDYYGGDTAHNESEARRLRDALNDGKAGSQLAAAARYLSKLPKARGTQIATLGVSLGCRWAMALAEAMPQEVAASVIFYGLQRSQYRRARAAFLGHFGKDDPLTPLEDIRALESTLKLAGCDVSFEIYDHVGHSFFETDRPNQFDPATALLAWNRTLEFLHQHMDEAPRR